MLANLNRPLLAWSGANPVTASAIRSADLVDVGFDAQTDEYHRANNRPAPSNLFATTSGLYNHAGDARAAPALFQYDAGTTWPVLTAEATPRMSHDQWTFTIEGLVDREVTWTWDEIHELPQSTYDGAIHCVTTWSKFDMGIPSSIWPAYTQSTSPFLRQ